MKRKGAVLVAVLVIFFGLASESPGNKASVQIDAPERAAKGSEVTIKIHVFHEGNNYLHHTSWVSVKVNGQEITRWDFSAFSRPEAGDFTREITYKLVEAAEIVAEANCNIHGSAGPVTWTLAVE